MAAVMLNGMKSIAAFLDCGRDRVRELVAQGAPIRVLGTGDGKRYMADPDALRAWVSNLPAPSRS